MSDDDLVASFLAERGVTQVATAPAYGVDRDADKARRIEARERRMADEAERYSEQRAEYVRDAAHVGGRSAAFEAMDEFDAIYARRDGRRVRFNRF